MHQIIHDIIESKQAKIERLYQIISHDRDHAIAKVLDGEDVGRAGVLMNTLKLNPFNIIAEFKRYSPAKGELNCEIPIEQQLNRYLHAGANGVSILTETQHFQGSMHDLKTAIDLTKPLQVPVVRKDFITDEIQIAESVTLGCSAILLIVGILGAKTENCLTAARQFGIDVLLEVHTQDELDYALTLPAPIIGINNRDLTTFQVDPLHALKLKATNNTADKCLIAESGLSTPEQVAHYREAGFSGVLIGSSLMKAPDPARLIRQFKGEDDATAH